MAVRPIPDGYYTVTPFLGATDCGKLIDFLKQAFGAEEIMRMPGPGGVVVHAEVNIGNSRVMMGNASGSANSLFLYVEDVDALYKRAIKAGAASEREPTNEFWGDRAAKVKDPFGNTWWIATHIEDVTPQELGKRVAAATRG
jgi:PhnB protein